MAQQEMILRRERTEIVFFLPEAHCERALSALGGLGLCLYHTTSDIGLMHIAKGSLALVALACLHAALVVYYQDGNAFCPKGLDALLEGAYYFLADSASPCRAGPRESTTI
jgi:hypothetical protein